jgi:hypothetical protein
MAKLLFSARSVNVAVTPNGFFLVRSANMSTDGVLYEELGKMAFFGACRVLLTTSAVVVLPNSLRGVYVLVSSKIQYCTLV